MASITGLNRMRSEPITRMTVVSQPYLPRRPSSSGCKGLTASVTETAGSSAADEARAVRRRSAATERAYARPTDWIAVLDSKESALTPALSPRRGRREAAVRTDWNLRLVTPAATGWVEVVVMVSRLCSEAPTLFIFSFNIRGHFP